MGISLEKYELHPYELTQLINLCPVDVESAKELIRSLKEKDDATIQNMLDDISKFKSYV